ncbi:MAG: carboxypeptidase-like regulatory domain-containing protein [Planctomycetota bacterium]
MKRLWFALLPLALLAVVTGVFLLWPEPAALPLLADSRAATAEVGAAADERAAARTEPAGAREEITAPLMPEPEAAASVVLVGSLTGRVVGRDTGALAGATVALDWEDPAGATRAAIGLRPTATDARGRFAYADLLASGRYRVRVRCAGFVPLHSSDLGIYPGQSTDAGDLVLTPGARLVGSIADDRGAPLARASVQIKDRDQGSALTDDRGEFVLADLEAGPVVVLASAADCWPAQQEVTLEAGREAPPVRFTLRRPAIITGSVSSRDHAAIAGATVRTSARGNGPPVLTDAQGRYRLQVAQRDQSYRVEVAALGHRPQARGLVAPQDNADFVLEPLPRIEVLLRDASTGAPIKPLVLRRRGNQPRLAAEPESMAAPPRSADDERAWQRLGPGRYGVFYSQPGTYRVVALADGYAASETEPVAADGTSSYGPFLMAMSKLDATETGAVGGIVRNLSTQAPVAGATVELCDDASDSGARALFRYGVLVPASGAVVATTRTDPQGRFLFTELKSQGYTLRAISSSHAASESVNSAVVAGVASPDVELWLRRGGAIAGVVRGLDGAALADLPLVVLRADGFADVTRTDTAGAYRFDRLAAGSYRVETGDRTTAPSQEWPRGKGAGGSALEARDFHVEVAEGRVTPLDIDLQHPPAGPRCSAA